jgi:hypothetical protein
MGYDGDGRTGEVERLCRKAACAGITTASHYLERSEGVGQIASAFLVIGRGVRSYVHMP